MDVNKYAPQEQSAQDRRSSAPVLGQSRGGGSVMGTARAMNTEASEGLASKAWRHARSAADDAARHERLAETLTPEIETMLWCWQECLALGLIDVQVIADAAARDQRQQALLRRGVPR